MQGEGDVTYDDDDIDLFVSIYILHIGPFFLPLSQQAAKKDDLERDGDGGGRGEHFSHTV